MEGSKVTLLINHPKELEQEEEGLHLVYKNFRRNHQVKIGMEQPLAHRVVVMLETRELALDQLGARQASLQTTASKDHQIGQ